MSVSTLQKEINKQLDGCFEEMVEIRRHFHMYPELSFQEEKTAAFIASYYESLGVPIRTNVGGRGVLANIEGSEPGPTVALRADFDALPIQDEKMSLTPPKCLVSCMHAATTATPQLFSQWPRSFTKTDMN